MRTVLHEMAWRAMVARRAGNRQRDAFFQMIHGAGVILADGATEVHKTTVARQVLRDYRRTDDMWPTQWIPGKLDAARARFAEVLELEVGNTGRTPKQRGSRRRSSPPGSDDRIVKSEASPPSFGLLEVYDRALPQVYGYLMSRCGERSVAEDLTSETFLAAAQLRPEGTVSIGWLIGVARHKLADHWRRHAREERLLRVVDANTVDSHDPWDAHLDVLRARQVLAELAPQHRAALTLRYLDGLSVPRVASVLGRTVDATEALLVRARRELRRAYEAGGAHA